MERLDRDRPEDWVPDTFTDVLGKFRSVLRGQGYDLIADGGPKTNAGFSVYRKTYGLKGLETPKDWFIWKRIEEFSDLIEFKHQVKRVIKALLADSPDDWLSKQYEYIRKTLVDGSLDGRGLMATQAHHELNYYKPPVSGLSGQSGLFKSVPNVDWFPESVQAIDAKSLLSILPEAEKDMMVMFIGRILAGASGEQVQHGFRHFGIVVGKGAAGSGTGKSSFFGWFIEALETLGYRTAILDTNFGKFGWAGKLLSDFLYCDDFTDKIQKKVISSDVIKVLASGGRRHTEEKGMPALDIKTRTVFLACSNGSSYSDLVSVDSGVKSRLCQMETLAGQELTTEEGKSLRSRDYWDDQGHDPQVLMMWLMRHCLDRFLEVIGYQADPVTGGFNVTKSTLEPYVQAVRSKLRIETDLLHVNELVRVCCHFQALAIAKDPRTTESVKRLGFGINFVMIALSHRVSSFGIPKWPGYEGLELMELDQECVPWYAAKLREINSSKASISMQTALDKLLGELRSTKAIGYPRSLGRYHMVYEQESREIPRLVKYYQGLDLPVDLGDILLVNLSMITGISEQ
jgi:hypothetical protein